MLTSEVFYEETVHILSEYRPWGHHKQSGGDSSNYPTASKLLLDFKDGNIHAITAFKNAILPYGDDYAVAVVPGHNPEKAQGSLHRLAFELSKSKIFDASSALVRHTLIAKLAQGGSRNVKVHLDSIHIPNPELVNGKEVLLIDDIVTSGGSLAACGYLLRQAGAKSVSFLALGRTTY